MESFIDLNVVIIPSEEIQTHLIELSEEISAKYKTNYTLEKTQFLPHFSLYSARYPQKNYDAVLSSLATIAKQTKAINVTLSGYSDFNAFIFYDIRKNLEIMKLHETIVDTLNPLREGMISDNMKALTNLTAPQTQAIQTYGYVSVKDLYMPHISLTNLVDRAQARDVITKLPKKELTFPANSFSLSPFAAYGTCPSIITSYEFEN